MSGTWWVSEAPCVGDVRFTPDDATEDSLRAPQTRRLLTVCRRCPFRAQCIDLVLPSRSLFDGICGGRLWLNGQILATCKGARPDELEEGADPINHGTEAGARAHNRRGETACSWCREAGRLAQQARRDRKPAPGQ
ncbi:hypothetical protein [Streptomyces sp. Isolate_219]|uniref:hypothetical protein n=1 Tax=Streptomyces sp. Isolate_219 TaxID=2950110 RepID=UPI0021C88BA1|nr:hypothetical protein [Streptomyces sp. Isolate_219]MCR8573058.1 hypothetical protein [Streptomyces sp. Isolate_219]